jgi:hypothetical protein
MRSMKPDQVQPPQRDCLAKAGGARRIETAYRPEGRQLPRATATARQLRFARASWKKRRPPRNAGARFAVVSGMKRSEERRDDMMTLARLHAALDSMVDTEQVMTQIHESSVTPQPTVARVRELVAEARELLRWMLARPEARHVVGNPLTRPDPGIR